MSQPDGSARGFEAVVEAIDGDLPEMARAVISAYLDRDDPDTASFLRAPDSREQHQTHWHQWGIITHTRVFLHLMRSEVPQRLRAWELLEPIDAVLRRRIDGATRWKLLEVSILLHDIGKFAARTHGRQTFHFSGHEVLSGEIIRHRLDLGKYGLSSAQIEYVARTAEDHFVLGLVRRRAREVGKYDVAYAHSQIFEQVAADIVQRYTDDPLEIGVLFLGDSLSKVGPDSGLERALAQNEVNVAVARQYLRQAIDILSL